MMKKALASLALSGSLLASPLAADVEDTLNARYRGAFVVVAVPLASDCGGFYTDNELTLGNKTTGSGGHRFAAGELARVERVDVKRNRIDVFLDLPEPILVERRDGPFTLYDELFCKAQLKVPTQGDAGRERALDGLVEVFEGERSARSSRSWNGRVRRDYPKDYDQTLAEYQVWKAAQFNVAVQERLDRAIEEAARFQDLMRSNPDYLAGFAAGMERVRSRSYPSCEGLVGDSFYPDSKSGESGDYRRGYEDGQRLGYNLGLLRRLRACFVPVPVG
jgi:hypothetical protein